MRGFGGGLDLTVPLGGVLLKGRARDDFGDAVITSLSEARLPVPHDVLSAWLAQVPPTLRHSLGARLLAGSARLFELEAAGFEEAVALACLTRALLLDMQDDSRGVLAELDRLSPGSLSGRWESVVGSLRATALLQLGHAGVALDVADRSLADANPAHRPLVSGVRLQALWYEGRVAEALEQVPGVIDDAEKSGHRPQLLLALAQAAQAHALQGQRDQAAAHLVQVQASAPSGSPLLETAVSFTEATLAVVDDDPAAARDVLRSHLASYPLGQGLSAAAHRRSLALIYILVPETRPVWEEADLGPTQRTARDLGRAMSAVLETGTLPRNAPALPESGVIRAHLPQPWVAALGVAAVAAGREDGRRLLAETWPALRPAVVDLAENDAGPLARAARTVLAQLAVPPTLVLQFRLLGPLELWRGDEPVRSEHWRRDRVRSLLAYLVLHGAASREQVADDLWPKLDADRQAANLRVTLSYMLRVLEPERRRRDASFFLPPGDFLSLHPGDWLKVDVWDFDAACAQVEEATRQNAPSDVLSHALQAVDLWRGEPTKLVSEGWAVPLWERRRIRFAAVAIRAGELLLARGRADQALTLAERALGIDPWLEAAHALVIATHQHTGNIKAAWEAVERYRAALVELGLAPGDANRTVERLPPGRRARTLPPV